MAPIARSGIQISPDGSSFIPSSQRADGSTRREIRVRPGYKPPEDVERYKTRGADLRQGKPFAGVPGVEVYDDEADGTVNKSKNAKRREAARKRQQENTEPITPDLLVSPMCSIDLQSLSEPKVSTEGEEAAPRSEDPDEPDAERQKKVRNLLKKLRAVQDLKSKKASGGKLSHEQLSKMGKEAEILRDLKKLDYDGLVSMDEATND